MDRGTVKSREALLPRSLEVYPLISELFDTRVHVVLKQDTPPLYVGPPPFFQFPFSIPFYISTSITTL